MKYDFRSNITRFAIDNYYLLTNKYFRGYNQIRKLIFSSQYYSREAIEQLQMHYLKKLIFNAYNGVPYYHDLFEKSKIDIYNITSINQLYNIPILTKDIIRNNGDKLKNSKLDEDRFLFNSTSGSSGDSLYFFSDKGNISWNIALQDRKYNWMDISRYNREYWIWGRNFSNERISKTKKMASGIKRKKVISSYQLSQKDVNNIIKDINIYKPILIGAYPSHLSYIAKNATVKLKQFPIAVSLGGEMSYPDQLETINNFFKVKAFNYYGSRDGGQIAQECKEHNGLHIFSENVVVEVLDDNNQPVKEGIGRIVLTLLHNYTMPLIRYEIGDLAEIDNTMWEKCKCGVTLPRIKRIIGRTFDLITFPNGNKVGGTFWTLLMKSIEGIDKYKVYQDNIGHIKISYISQSQNDIDKNKIFSKIYEYGGKNASVELERVSYLEDRTSIGKFQFVKSDYRK